MSEIATTPFSKKTAILAELWMDYRDEPGYKDLLEYGDLGFPLAYAFYNLIAEPNEVARTYIDELWDLLLAGLDIEDSGDFDTLNDLFAIAPNGGDFVQD